ncbi:MAG: sulfatase-like hydrolase/transferase, partial [Armatimonadia bacterium]|nr:sulfatase-like hydrolase/transferase [Armatimonadia bacterium]
MQRRRCEFKTRRMVAMPGVVRLGAEWGQAIMVVDCGSKITKASDPSPARTIEVFVLSAAATGVATAIMEVLAPTSVAMDLTVYLAGTALHSLGVLALHVPVASVAGLVMALAILGIRKLPVVRDLPWTVVAVALPVAASVVSALVSRHVGSDVGFLWGWLAVLWLLLALSGVLFCPGNAPLRGAGVAVAFGVLATVTGMALGLRFFSPGMTVLIAIAAIVLGAAVGLAAHALGRLLGRLPAWPARAGVVAGVVAIFTGVVFATVAAHDQEQWPEAQSTNSDQLSVILISVDTLRADTVGYSGMSDVRTPNIDRLAGESYVFTRALAPSPWTRPSFAAVMSSRYPHEMGVARARGFEGAGTGSTPFVWRTDRDLLAEVLHDAGYATAAVVTNPNLKPEAASDQGCGLYRHVVLPPAPGDTRLAQGLAALSVLPRQLSATLDDRERAQHVTETLHRLRPARVTDPTMVWVHYMDPHDPYDSPDAPLELRCEPPLASTVAGWANGGAADRLALLEAYRLEAEYFDKWLGTLIADLDEAGLWDNSVVVFWSDHGEEFWEHDGWQHGHTLYQELMHVPMMIHLPGQEEGAMIHDRVSLLDIMPTVLELCEQAQPEGLRGMSLVPLLEGGSLPPRRIMLEGCTHGSIRKGVVDGDLKLIYDAQTEMFELYDLAADPTERNNLYGLPNAPDVVDLEQYLVDWSANALA